MGHADDDTIVVRRPKPRRLRLWLALAGAALLAALLAFAFWPRPPAGLPLADLATIEAEAPATLTLHRFAANPRILVLDFPDLQQQGRMLNRLAAFAEKAGAPRDRILAETELTAILRAHGETAANYYYGHDYDSQTIARFFATAERDATRLNPQETTLRDLSRAQGLLEPRANQAIITLPKLFADPSVDATFRHTILVHELSHGEFFTNPAYRAYVQSFWQTKMTAPSRAAFTRFLTLADYDPAQPELIENETQAYLVFTPDPRLISPAALGLPPETLAALRTAFTQSMPQTWLRDLATK